jgi:hypothetical protein
VLRRRTKAERQFAPKLQSFVTAKQGACPKALGRASDKQAFLAAVPDKL